MRGFVLVVLNDSKEVVAVEVYLTRLEAEAAAFRHITVNQLNVVIESVDLPGEGT